MSRVAYGGGRALVHLGAGIGDIVLATPLIVALHELGLEVELTLHADYPDTASLFAGWAAVSRVRALRASEPPLDGMRFEVVVPAIPPFYWARMARHYARIPHAVARPPDALFHADQQGWYLDFARRLGYPEGRRPPCVLPIVPGSDGKAAGSLVIAPGCKTGIMAAKRWPHWVELARRFDDVVLVGTRDDLRNGRDRSLEFPPHVRSLVDALTLRETAEVLAGAGVVVANDSGLAHVSAAVGAPTVLLFGPTPHETIGGFPPNVSVLRGGLACEPCWRGARLRACAGRVDCLTVLTVDAVERAVLRQWGAAPARRPVQPRMADRAVTPAAACVAVPATSSPARPLVSCIMPTCDRPRFVAQAARYFLRQDWPDRELLVVDDSREPVEHLLPADERIHYLRLEGRRTVGAKRNLACEQARGAYIVHWDDDDWMAPGRISAQMAMLSGSDDAVCGASRLLFMDPVGRRAWHYSYEARGRPWVAGGTLCYPRAVWERRPFPDVREGEDTRFVLGLRGTPVLSLADTSLYVGLVHAGNTSRKQTGGARWQPYPWESVCLLMGEDAAFYDAMREPANISSS